jgi:hypothetical protein
MGRRKYSGLLEVALAAGYVGKPSNGWYCRVDRETGEIVDPKYREKDTLTAEFWDPIFNGTDFKEFIQKQYTIGHKALIELDIE